MNIFIRLIIPLLLLASGIGGAVVLASSAKKEERVDVPTPKISVSVFSVQNSSQQVILQSSGVVQAAQTVRITPQVSGKLNSVADNLQPGRRFAKGDLLVKIDSKDYRLALEQEKSRVERAALELQIEQKRQESAQKEWELLGNEGAPTDLASRKPQLQVAQINLEAAEAAMERARVMVNRTRIVAPFDGIVQSEQVEYGQVVNVGSPLLTLIGTNQYWVRVAVPASRLQAIEIPDITGDTGSLVKIRYAPSPEQEQIRDGVVLRMEAQLDQQSRTAHLLIGIDNPLDGFPLMLGAYVDVEIMGKKVPSGVRIPASALREGSHVLIADEDNKLAKKDVVVGWVEKEEVVIVDGLEDGVKVVTSQMSMPIYGSLLEIVAPQEKETADENNDSAGGE